MQLWLGNQELFVCLEHYRPYCYINYLIEPYAIRCDGFHQLPISFKQLQISFQQLLICVRNASAGVVLFGAASVFCGPTVAQNGPLPDAAPEISAQETMQKADEAYKAGDMTRFGIFTRKAADLGVARAQFNVGLMYDSGQGVARDYAQAVIWYRKAANQGLAPAQNNLGSLYENGQGVARDYAQAMSWFRKAADQGYAVAQSNVGEMYEKGLGVPKDIAQATVWYEKAAELGNEKAKAKLAEFQEASSVKAETLDLVCRNAKGITLVSIDTASKTVKMQGGETAEFKDGNKYYVTITNDLIEFGCRKSVSDVDVAAGIAASVLGDEKARPLASDLACLSKHRIDRHTGIWTASTNSPVTGQQSNSAECSVAPTSRKF
jgi:hypothetical protein